MKDWILAQKSLEFLIGGYIRFVALGVKRPFFIPNVTDRDQRSVHVSIEPTVAGSWDDRNEVVGVQDEEKTSTITPLGELGRRRIKRRMDTLFSLLKEEAEDNNSIVRIYAAYIHDRAVAAVGLKLFTKKQSPER